MFRLNQFLLALALMPALSAYAGSIEVIVENAKIAEGQLMMQIMRGEKEFSGKEAAIVQIQRRASAGEMRFFISNLPEGDYALQIMHDVNGNGELDTNFVGIPNEPWAFSNNAVGMMGPPKWDAAKFTVLESASESVTQSIQLND